MPPQTSSFDGPTCDELRNNETGPPKDLYTVLELARDATTSAIRKSFLRLARQYHPDKQADPSRAQDASVQFQQVRKAFEVLKDPESRCLYDMQLAIRNPNVTLSKTGPRPGHDMYTASRTATTNEPHATIPKPSSSVWTESEKDVFFNTISTSRVNYEKLAAAIPTKSLADIRRFYFTSVNEATEFARVHPQMGTEMLTGSIEAMLQVHWKYVKTGKVPARPASTAPESHARHVEMDETPPPPPEPVFPSASTDACTTSAVPPAPPFPHMAAPSAPKASNPTLATRSEDRLARIAAARERANAKRRALGLKVKRMKPGTLGAPGRPRKVPLAKVEISAI